MTTIKKAPPANPKKYLQFFIIGGLLIFYSMLFNQNKNNLIPYNQFKSQLSAGLIKSVAIIGLSEIKGEYFNAQESEATTLSKRKKTASKTFSTLIPGITDPALMPLLEKNNVIIVAHSNEPSLMTSILINLLPWIIIIGFFYYSSKKMGQGLGGGMRPPMGMPSFGKKKSSTKNKDPDAPKITYNDVAGQENAKLELTEIVDFLKHPQKYEKLGATLPKGILLVGPPGTGKTLMAKATAGEADVNFFDISGSEFIELYVGMGASRVRNLFESARKAAPSIIFIDEIDSIGRARGSGVGGGHDEREQTLNQILSEMDGFSSNGPVVIMAATNRPDILDSALTRPGRFDRQVTLNLPQLKARIAILTLHAKKVPLARDVDFSVIGKTTIGFSGADLKNLVNEAALICARRNGKVITALDFDNARDKILMGLPREETLSAKEKEVVAVHEAGHAIVALKTPGSDPVKKITIMPRGKALGFTEQLPEEERFNYSKTYLLGQIKILLGGRLAENMIFNEITTGAENDLKRSTKLAKKMVTNWGMGKKLGYLAYEQGEEHMFLGRELSHQKEFSEKTAEIIDEEVKSIINECQAEVIKLLKANKDILLKISAKLMEVETVGEKEIAQCLDG